MRKRDNLEIYSSNSRLQHMLWWEARLGVPKRKHPRLTIRNGSNDKIKCFIPVFVYRPKGRALDPTTAFHPFTYPPTLLRPHSEHNSFHNDCILLRKVRYALLILSALINWAAYWFTSYVRTLHQNYPSCINVEIVSIVCVYFI